MLKMFQKHILSVSVDFLFILGKKLSFILMFRINSEIILNLI